jgi:serine/threonine-protein kinase
MMNMPNADRHELIEAFALQMKFIDQAQFREAMCVWNLERSRLLDEILLEHGSLDRETHALLVAVVDKHLQLHGGTAETSPVSAPSASSGGDETLVVSPESHALPALAPLTEMSDGDSFKTLVGGLGNSAPAAGRFRVTGSPNKGGMGQVSAALDGELNREVALKEIRAEYADDEDCRVRFVQEAEITRGLEHPGIVPVYGLGRHGDGRPFYAMRFIRGNSFQDAIDQFHSSVDASSRNTNATNVPSSRASFRAPNCEFDSIEFRKLLGRFIDVCNAMEYAHSRGVIHRDLKPSNIMLGKYGETLVVDWGLAKAKGRADTTSDKGEVTLRPSSGSGSTPTQMGQAHGTPGLCLRNRRLASSIRLVSPRMFTHWEQLCIACSPAKLLFQEPAEAISFAR